MFSEEELLKEEKDCADMLGMSLDEYRDYVRQTKVKMQEDNKRDYNDKILEELGLTEKDLKRRKEN